MKNKIEEVITEWETEVKRVNVAFLSFENPTVRGSALGKVAALRECIQRLRRLLKEGETFGLRGESDG